MHIVGDDVDGLQGLLRNRHDGYFEQPAQA